MWVSFVVGLINFSWLDVFFKTVMPKSISNSILIFYRISKNCQYVYFVPKYVSNSVPINFG